MAQQVDSLEEMERLSKEAAYYANKSFVFAIIAAVSAGLGIAQHITGKPVVDMFLEYVSKYL